MQQMGKRLFIALVYALMAWMALMIVALVIVGCLEYRRYADAERALEAAKHEPETDIDFGGLSRWELECKIRQLLRDDRTRKTRKKRNGAYRLR